MAARGDLGVELPMEEIPILQKELLRAATRAGRPVIVATQMLESMVAAPRPTRAESTDVANAVLDGADAIMLSAETAIGEFPIEAARAATRIAEVAEERGGSFVAAREACTHTDEAAAVAHAAARIAADDLDVVAIACYTTTGRTAALLSTERPRVPIYADADRRRVDVAPESGGEQRARIVAGCRAEREDRVAGVRPHGMRDPVGSNGEPRVVAHERRRPVGVGELVRGREAHVGHPNRCAEALEQGDVHEPRRHVVAEPAVVVHGRDLAPRGQGRPLPPLIRELSTFAAHGRQLAHVRARAGEGRAPVGRDAPDDVVVTAVDHADAAVQVQERAAAESGRRAVAQGRVRVLVDVAPEVDHDLRVGDRCAARVVGGPEHAHARERRGWDARPSEVRPGIREAVGQVVEVRHLDGIAERVAAVGGLHDQHLVVVVVRVARAGGAERPEQLLKFWKTT